MSDRRTSDGDDTGREMRRFASQYPHLVTWVLTGLVGLLVTGGGLYIRGYETRLARAEKQITEDRTAYQDQKGTLKVIEERGGQNAKDIQEIKGDVKDIQKDIKELLRQDQRRRDGTR